MLTCAEQIGNDLRRIKIPQSVHPSEGQQKHQQSDETLHLKSFQLVYYDRALEP